VLTDANFEEQLDKYYLLLVYFYSPEKYHHYSLLPYRDSSYENVLGQFLHLSEKIFLNQTLDSKIRLATLDVSNN
jgi:hypothetical protein